MVLLKYINQQYIVQIYCTDFFTFWNGYLINKHIVLNET